jgi:glycosyltransferase involved in cell wall biosynthesis
MSRLHIAFVVQYPKGVSPSQRFRCELWEGALEKAQISHETFPFIDSETRKVIYQRGHYFGKALGVVMGYWRRLRLLFSLHKFDYVFVQREATPFGPPIFEWVASYLLKSRVIFDFDDAIWIPTISAENQLAEKLKFFGKTKYVCACAHKVVVGNDFLANFARSYSQKVYVIPTCVDTSKSAPLVKKHDQIHPLTVGWTGSFSTLKYLELIIPALQAAQAVVPFRFVVIADRAPELPGLDYEFIKWSEENELLDLSRLDVGVMPLIEDRWSEGKCGFKLIQYFSLGIPALASPVGVNSKILEHDISGYLCQTTEEWCTGICTLLKDAELRNRMGTAGRKKIVDSYSVKANAEAFLSLFDR